MNDPLENFEDMNEYEQDILEQKLLNTAFTNSFNIITKRKTISEVVEETGGLLIAHDPMRGLKIRELSNMIDFFVEGEHYEKCAEVAKLIKKVKAKNEREYKKNSTKEFNTIFNNALRGAKKGKNSDS
tara:strand:+ start:2534 stop:2917 length:384 start_codon:yes stop_codon:yes gene_type:complete